MHRVWDVYKEKGDNVCIIYPVFCITAVQEAPSPPSRKVQKIKRCLSVVKDAFEASFSVSLRLQTAHETHLNHFFRDALATVADSKLRNGTDTEAFFCKHVMSPFRTANEKREKDANRPHFVNCFEWQKRDSVWSLEWTFSLAIRNYRSDTVRSLLVSYSFERRTKHNLEHFFCVCMNSFQK